jgi:hypothetical protein
LLLKVQPSLLKALPLLLQFAIREAIGIRELLTLLDAGDDHEFT